MPLQFFQGGPRLDLPPEESTDLEELEQFAKMFKQKRIKLGTYFLKYYCLFAFSAISVYTNSIFRIHSRGCWPCHGQNVRQ